jgi:cell division protein FtsQ
MDAGRQGLRVLLVVVGAVVLAASGWAAVHSPLLDVDHVVIRGVSGEQEREVRAASGVAAGEALLLVDLGAAERRVENVPWVREARAERELPGGLRIRVVERTPIAWARRDESTVALVDETGRVVMDTPAAPGGLPELLGLARLPLPGRAIRPAAALGMLGALPVELRQQVAGVAVVGGTATLRLTGGTEVRLGAPADAAAKGRAALAVLAASAPASIDYVDVRVPAAPVTG